LVMPRCADAWQRRLPISVILALPRFFVHLVRRLSRWLNPSPDQRMHSTRHKRDARQQAHNALRKHYPGSGGPGWR